MTEADSTTPNHRTRVNSISGDGVTERSMSSNTTTIFTVFEASLNLFIDAAFRARTGTRVALVVLLAGAGLEAAPHRGRSDLGTLGGAASEAPSISNNGVVVGDSGVAGDSNSHGFRWTRTHGMVDLGTLGGASSTATAVSDDGRFVVGSSATENGGQHAFRWSQRGGMVDLTPYTWESSRATAVGDNGTVAGNSYNPSTGANRGFVWTERNGLIDLGTLGGYMTTVKAISRSGSVVAGESSLAGEIEVHAFVWTRARGMIDLGTLGGRWSYTDAVSDTGTVVGSSGLATGKVSHAFAWTEADGLMDLSAQSSESTRATAINHRGAIAGVRYVVTADPRVSVSRACVWTAGGRTIDVGTLGGPFSWSFGISNDDRVVGMSQMSDGSTHAFAWSRTHGLVDLSALGSSYGVAQSVTANGEWAVGVDGGHATLWRLDDAFLARAFAATEPKR
jgi:probable HAF family extracellular repeat protein